MIADSTYYKVLRSSLDYLWIFGKQMHHRFGKNNEKRWTRKGGTYQIH
jgi:hypothetical protein